MDWLQCIRSRDSSVKRESLRWRVRQSRQQLERRRETEGGMSECRLWLTTRLCPAIGVFCRWVIRVTNQSVMIFPVISSQNRASTRNSTISLSSRVLSRMCSRLSVSPWELSCFSARISSSIAPCLRPNRRRHLSLPALKFCRRTLQWSATRPSMTKSGKVWRDFALILLH